MFRADLNLSPNMDACIVVPEGGASCKSRANQESTIDFIIVSRGLRADIASARFCWKVPFKPHAAIRVILTRRAENDFGFRDC